MTRVIKQPKTIMKHVCEDCYSPSDAIKLSEFTVEQIEEYMENFAKSFWHNGYVDVDYSKLTEKHWRDATIAKAAELKVFWKGFPEEFM